ncbi:MAG: hypothetical protein EOO59_02555, partial [Hymenobacter sp.]
MGLGEVAAARAYVAEAQTLVPAAHDPLATGAVHLLLGDLSRQQRQWAAARCSYAQVCTTYAGGYNAQGLLPYEVLMAKMTCCLGELPAGPPPGCCAAPAPAALPSRWRRPPSCWPAP